MSKVITVSRELGSGGREVGLRLAKKLGIPFYDKELIAMAAEDSNISEDLFHANDEVIGLEKEPEDLKKLESRIRAVDAKRRDYYQYYSGNEWGKPKNYDLCLNSGTLGIERCVEIIANSVTLE